MKQRELSPDEQVYFVTTIPKNTVELAITAKVYVNGEILAAHMKIDDMEEIRECILKGEQWGEENTVWKLTDKALQSLEE